MLVDWGTSPLGWLLIFFIPVGVLVMKARRTEKGKFWTAVRENWREEIRDVFVVTFACSVLIFSYELFWGEPFKIWNKASGIQPPLLLFRAPSSITTDSGPIPTPKHTPPNPNQVLYGEATELADHIQNIGDDLNNRIDDLLRRQQEHSLGPHGFNLFVQQAYNNADGKYQENYKEKAIYVRQKMLEDVPDVPIDGHLGVDGIYIRPTNTFGFRDVAKNLRDIAQEFAQKHKLKFTPPQ
jgi:hypothetical protein